LRKVILHYHLFKNAGTSLDAAFKENFSEEKGEWVTKEFPNQPAANREQVRQWILDNPQAKCFSSHTALLPPPNIEEITIIPIIFMRQPIDRIVSAYLFERKQKVENFGATLAKHTDLKGYVHTRLMLPGDKQCKNFHVERFSSTQNLTPKDKLENAIQNIKSLPFVGIVEKFSESLEKLNILMESNGFPSLNINLDRKNTTRDQSLTLEKKITDAKESLGPKVWDILLKANNEDLRLYDYVNEIFQDSTI